MWLEARNCRVWERYSAEIVYYFPNHLCNLQYSLQVSVTVPEHKACKCKCSVTEKDCNKLQTYVQSQCQCKCTNQEDQDNCIKQSSIKIWDNNSCTCLCREQKECSTGFHFDSTSCSCVEVI
jgi:hypothetical protein